MDASLTVAGHTLDDSRSTGELSVVFTRETGLGLDQISDTCEAPVVTTHCSQLGAPLTKVGQCCQALLQAARGQEPPEPCKR